MKRKPKLPSGIQLEDFNIHKALSGTVKVVTDKGQPLSQIAYFPDADTEWPIVGCVDGEILAFTLEGECSSDDISLKIQRLQASGVMNIYRLHDKLVGGYVHKDEEEALASVGAEDVRLHSIPEGACVGRVPVSVTL